MYSFKWWWGGTRSIYLHTNLALSWVLFSICIGTWHWYVLWHWYCFLEAPGGLWKNTGRALAEPWETPAVLEGLMESLGGSRSSKTLWTPKRIDLEKQTMTLHKWVTTRTPFNNRHNKILLWFDIVVKRGTYARCCWRLFVERQMCVQRDNAAEPTASTNAATSYITYRNENPTC